MTCKDTLAEARDNPLHPRVYSMLAPQP